MSLDLKNKETKAIEKRRIIPLFHTYILHEFGEEQWEKYMDHPVFNEMMIEMEPRYGDSVFSTLVDTVVEMDKISHIKLLRDFSKFVNSYY